MKLNPTYSSGDINFIHDESQIFVESIINNLDDNITPILGDDGNYHYVYLTVNKTNGFFYIGKNSIGKTFKIQRGERITIEAEKKLEYILPSYYGGGFNIQKAVKTEGRANFLRFVIKFCKSSKEGFDLENRLADEETLKQFFDLQCMYNIRTGGKNYKLLPNTNKNIGIAKERPICLMKNNNMIQVKPSEVLKYLLDGYVPKSHSIKLHKIENQTIKQKAIRLKKYRAQKLNSISELIHDLQNGWIFGHPNTLRAKQLLENQSIEQHQPVQTPQPVQPVQSIKQGRPKKPTFQFEFSLFDWQNQAT